MTILTARALGMCFGVRDALELMRQAAEPAQITVNGRLVHNPLVTRELEARGFTLAAEGSDTIPATPAVLITAHGVSDRQRSRLMHAGKRIIDATCPLVRRAHHAALQLQAQGFHVLVIGRRGHIEVRGLTGDLHSYDVLETVADVRRWAHAMLGIIAQTTSLDGEARSIIDAVRATNPHAQIRFINTICQPTRDRQRAVEELLRQVDLLVVVGGRSSNNTRHLAARARERGVKAVHVEAACELQRADFRPEFVVGLTGGTSTLPETLTEVRLRLEAMFATPQQTRLA